jgi:hypothetical protein
MIDEQGNYYRLLLAYLEEIVDYIKRNIKDKETKEAVDINIEILLHICQRILDNSYKQKADSSTDYRRYKDPSNVKGDRLARLES